MQHYRLVLEKTLTCRETLCNDMLREQRLLKLHYSELMDMNITNYCWKDEIKQFTTDLIRAKAHYSIRSRDVQLKEGKGKGWTLTLEVAPFCAPKASSWTGWLLEMVINLARFSFLLAWALALSGTGLTTLGFSAQGGVRGLAAPSALLVLFAFAKWGGLDEEWLLERYK